MEQPNRIQTKITPEGLIAEISTKNDVNYDQNTTNNIKLQELYKHKRLNSEINDILKISTIPYNLHEFAIQSHNFYSSKYSKIESKPTPAQSLRNKLKALLDHNFISLPQTSLFVFFLMDG